MTDALFFTVAWLRQLPQVMELADSLAAVYPAHCLHVGLVDPPEAVPRNLPVNLKIHPVSVLDLPDFEDLIQKYTRTEFRNLTKPFFARYFLNTFPETQQIIGLSPESRLLAPLDALHQALTTQAIVLVSQLTAPPRAGSLLIEGHFLNVGTYDAGLWGVRRSDVALHFLDWWAGSLRQRGWLRLCAGFGSDQLWLDLVPAFFDDVAIFNQSNYVVKLPWDSASPVADTTVLLQFEGVGTDRARLPKAAKRLLTAYRDGIASRPDYQFLRNRIPAFGLPDPLLPASPWRRTLARPIRRVIRLINRFQPDFLYKTPNLS